MTPMDAASPTPIQLSLPLEWDIEVRPQSNMKKPWLRILATPRGEYWLQLRLGQVGTFVTFGSSESRTSRVPTSLPSLRSWWTQLCVFLRVKKGVAGPAVLRLDAGPYASRCPTV